MLLLHHKSPFEQYRTHCPAGKVALRQIRLCSCWLIELYVRKPQGLCQDQ
jgi:hypothetical protein